MQPALTSLEQIVVAAAMPIQLAIKLTAQKNRYVDKNVFICMCVCEVCV